MKISTLKKSDTPLVCLTAYTAPIAKILDKHCDILLVGDSVGMVLYGMENTLGVSIDMMINHGKAVVKSSSNSIVVVDMPYDTYENDIETAFKNASRIIKETNCDAVKLEGGMEMAETISYLTNNGIPVMAHIGLLPQSVVKEGGYKIKGRTEGGLSKLIDDAKEVEKAGAFSVVIEGTVENSAAQITKEIEIPTIGIGASSECDGQILVTEDMLGLNSDYIPQFVKQYENL
ncbi:3-methyl-2-oxobutanoate hydroxymethyltransferase [Emcibacteraceae bacterium Y4]|nr:3-methyl-2-oxobutanoate hydroxymethyltransferase [Pseudemcibacter aquimaris]MCC3862371.1 3-methyl-2-oxobutanoate hydroxymethyltransferase [Pseudemcibacter aquimaris]WDU59198.1 3-methyl-2-oxobutanoate hydroxymethyltransferase [Pseudemcibacter aquimaris]